MESLFGRFFLECFKVHSERFLYGVFGGEVNKMVDIILSLVD